MKQINKIYIISLPHQKERLQRLQGLLEEENLNIPVEVVKATSWKDSNFKKLVETGKISGSKYWEDYFAANNGTKMWAPNTTINLGQMACCYTHLEVLKTIQNKKETALILQDDCYWDNIGTLKKAIDEYHNLILNHSDFGICYLGREQIFEEDELPEEAYKGTEFLQPEYSWNAHCFIISDKACKDILSQDIYTNMIPFDEYLVVCWGKSVYLRDDFIQYNKNLAKIFRPVTKAISHKNYEMIFQGDRDCLRGLGKSKFSNFIDSDIQNSGEYNGKKT
tara:strand:+ start:573 stop:1409 length:837 start_codon:yes stop_codon:yes gene_type:complete